MATIYTGPSAADMLAKRTLAKVIIARNNDPEPVLDTDELALLERFDLPAEPKNSGSLVAYVISLHDTDSPALSAEDISSLKEWFASNAEQKA
ncbi:hypothetical protein LZ30DRAFT_787767 [Colletotrichum cereale]|nr:hypothetical protein LZ30DRAFT_787767 [Colletotrichum cereale]